jgi:hypothetical protein
METPRGRGGLTVAHEQHMANVTASIHWNNLLQGRLKQVPRISRARLGEAGKPRMAARLARMADFRKHELETKRAVAAATARAQI